MSGNQVISASGGSNIRNVKQVKLINGGSSSGDQIISGSDNSTIENVSNEMTDSNVGSNVEPQQPPTSERPMASQFTSTTSNSISNNVSTSVDVRYGGLASVISVALLALIVALIVRRQRSFAWKPLPASDVEAALSASEDDVGDVARLKTGGENRMLESIVTEPSASLRPGLLSRSDPGISISLLEAVGYMDSLPYEYRGETRIFYLTDAEPDIQEFVEWAATEPSIADAREVVGVQELAAIRLWTSQSLFRVVNALLRDSTRDTETLGPTFPFLRLLFDGLHRLPERYRVSGVTLFRGEQGIRSNWHAAMHPGNRFKLYAPTSFSLDPKVPTKFMQNAELRTLTQLEGASGYLLGPFSCYPNEEEVLVEAITECEVTATEVLDANHTLVLAYESLQGHYGAQQLEGLHLVRARMMETRSLR